MDRYTKLSDDLPPVCRLGLATRGNTHLEPLDVHRAIDAGVNYLNWCGYADGMSRAIAAMSSRERDHVVVAKQFFAHSASEAAAELRETLTTLASDRLEVVTLYYIESEGEWERLAGHNGAITELQKAKRAGEIGLIGLTTHQRRLAVRWVETGVLDLVMVRYNAAHRGAEEDVFPVTAPRGTPVVAFTCQRWGHLARSTPEDPQGFQPPPAPEWYRFCLARPEVAVALMAPNGTEELRQGLALLDDWNPPSASELEAMRAHGARVRRSAGSFP